MNWDMTFFITLTSDVAEVIMKIGQMKLKDKSWVTGSTCSLNNIFDKSVNGLQVRN